MKLFAEQLGLFVDRAIIASLEPYKSVHARIDAMEVTVNDRIKDLTVPDLARFAVELKKVQEDVLKFKNAILGEQAKEIGKCPRDSARNEGKPHKKKKKKKHKKSRQNKDELREAIRTTVSSESQTFITPPPVTEATLTNPLSVPLIIDTTIEIPQTGVADPRVSSFTGFPYFQFENIACMH
ncbi:hypothetical protein HAX54_012816 [Datura stramonium]|uniref:FRIGIDA-like protein n=1 Tax=Datura stramonium TaxID=4076 RepID=A0ABS8TM68_DATST|nr:hypothetical protein [Datura stramonium]